MMVAVKVADLTIKSAISINKVSENLDKEKWENFWQVYNMVQKDCIFISEEHEEDVVNETSDNAQDDKYTCLQYHERELHPIVRQLIDNNISFNLEGGFYIEHNGVYAEAMLGFPDKKLFLRPLSEADNKIFIEAGYKEIAPEAFNINEIL